MSNIAGRVMIYGGKGALGSTCVTKFKANNYWVTSVDLHENSEADVNIIVGKDDDILDQEIQIINSVKAALNDSKFDAIFCVAGGWAGGNASKDLVKNSVMMWKQSVCSSVITASVASQFLKEGGVVAFTGAQAALEPTPGMIGYGLAKAAVHHMVKSLASDNSGLPANAVTAAILPVTLDTPMNRKWMPKADFGSWTSLEFVFELFFKWAKNEGRPSNGSLCQLLTKGGNTDVVPA